MQIKKIKMKDGRVLIDYEVLRSEGEPDQFSLNSGDTPLPEFAAALRALAPCICRECELPEEWAEKIAVRSCTISYYDDERMGVTMCGLRSLTNANPPLVLNSPQKPDEGSFDGDTKVLYPSTVSAVMALIRQAERFIAGERAQGTLELQDAA